nr:putative reverse transcriptase domain-containing protein [Tanacetum cinerariifolium]
SSQIQQAIANDIPSQVDASVRSYLSRHILHVHPTQPQTTSVPEKQYQLYLSMKDDPQLQQQDIAIWLALQMKFKRLQQWLTHNLLWSTSILKSKLNSKFLSRWVNKYVKMFNPYARYGVEHWKNHHAKIFYIRKQKEPGKPKEKVNLTAPTISFLEIEKHKMFSIIYEPVHGIIYKNSKKEKRFFVIHQPPQEMSIQEMKDLKQQYLDEMKRLINSEYRDEITIAELKENFNNMITPSLPTEEPDNSLSMGDEHLDTISATESNEFIKSSVENLVPIPNVSKKIFSNPLFEEEIIPMKIDQHHYNAESDLIESLCTHDSSIIISSKIDSLFDEFSSELTLLKSIPSRIDETNCYPEEETYFIKILLYDNSSPHPPKEFVSINYDTEIESFSLSPISVEDRILNVKMMGDISEQKVPIPRPMITLALNQEKYPDILSHQGLKTFQHFATCPMMIHRKNTPILDVPLFHLAAKEREVLCEAQQGRSRVERKLFRSFRNKIEGLNMRQRRWMELVSDYGYETKYHMGKENIVVDAWRRKRGVKPRRVRDICRTIQAEISEKMLVVYVEMSKVDNASTEMLRGLDQQIEKRDGGGL